MRRKLGQPSAGSLRWMLALPRAHPISAVASFGLGLIAVSFSTWLPRAIGNVIDGLAHHQPGAITTGIVSVLAVGVAQFACNGLRRAAGGYLGAHVEYDLRQRTVSHLLSLDQAARERSGTAELLSLTNSDIGTVGVYLSSGLALSLASLLTVLIAAAHLVLLAPPLALIALLLCPPLAVLAHRYDRLGNGLSRQVQQQIGELTAIVEEDAVGVRIIKAFRLEDRRRARFIAQAGLLQEENLRAARLRARFGPLLWLLPQLGLVTMLWYGGTRVAHGTLTLGSLTAANGYMTMIAASLTGLSSMAGTRQRALAGAERIRAFLDTRPTIVDMSGAPALPVPPGRPGMALVLRDVVFRRPGTRQVLLDHVDLTVTAGSRVALIGQTGAGKSTLAALLNRGLDPTGGTVLADGHDISEFSLESLRAQVIVVPSDPAIFADSLRANVAFGRPDATDDDVRQAMWAAAALDFANGLPGGLDEPIGERGQTVSGGQRQRIALARAVLMRPRLLIIDDGLSQLDPLTERLVLQRIATSMPDTTMLVIGRPRADRHYWQSILELRHGHLAAFDHHRLDDGPTVAALGQEAQR